MSRIRPLLVAALLFLAAGPLAPPAAAQLREGAYAVQGTNPDGSTYQGEFQLRPGPGGAWVGIWQVGDARLVGLAIIQGAVLAVSFVVEARPGIAAFELEPDGRLRGTWTTGGGIGTEILTPR